MFHKTLKKSLIASFGIASLMMLGTGTNAQVSTWTTLNLTITGGTVTHGSTGSFNFGTFTVSNLAQNVSGQFANPNYFFVNDLKGSSSGWYTTLQVTNLTGTAGTIGSGNVFIRVNNTLWTNTTTGIDLITGNINTGVIIGSGGIIGGTFSVNLATPVTFIQRLNTNAILGRRGILPWLQVTIPAFQSVGTYQGTLTYTLYEI